MSFIISSIINAVSSNNAANTAASSANNATDAQLQMFNTTEANTAPERALGQGASNMLANMYGIAGVANANGTTSKGGAAPNYSAFYQSPGYKFQLQQGEGEINKQAAANGGLYSSNTLGALNNYAQGTASTSYQNYLQSLMQMAGFGNAANATSASAATATGAGMSNSIMSGGNAAAAGQLGVGNAFANGIQGFGNLMANSNSTANFNSAQNAIQSMYQQNPNTPIGDVPG